MDMIQQIQRKVEELAPEFDALSQYIYDNPELGLEEYKSSAAHVKLLKEHHFDVEENYLNIPTAFRGTYDSQKPGPTIALLSEYDALPEIGHGCGHNLLGATNTGAGIVLRYLIDQYGGRVVVLGTPAEETNGVKVDMANADTFDDIDIALCTHPADQSYKSGTSTAMEAIEFSYKGQTAHAAANPHDGINALDAVILLFNGVALLRQQMKTTARIHGIITKGGVAANVIPDDCVAQFYLRATEDEYLEELHNKVMAIAEGAAQATGATLSWRHYEKSYKSLRTNHTLESVYEQAMNDLGIEMVEPKPGSGSLDMGDVSQVVPSINPYYGITNGQPMSPHTVEFREATLTKEGKQAMRETITALVKTSLDVIRDPNLLKAIQDEFEEDVLNK